MSGFTSFGIVRIAPGDGRVPMAVIAEALGHSDERITRKHYAHLSPSYVRDAIRGGLGSMGMIQMQGGPASLVESLSHVPLRSRRVTPRTGSGRTRCLWTDLHFREPDTLKFSSVLPEK